MRFESVPFARAYRETVEQGDPSPIPLHAIALQLALLDAGVRRRHHRCRSQRADLRRLPRYGRSESQGARTPSDRGRRGRDGRVSSGFPKLGRRLRREFVKPEDHRRSSAFRSRPQDRRAPRAKLPSGLGRQLPARGAGTHREQYREIQRQRCRTVCRLHSRARRQRRSLTRFRAAGAAKPHAGRKTREPRRGAQGWTPGQPAAPALHGKSADAIRPGDEIGWRLSRRLVRGRTGEGLARLRRHRRKLR